MLHGITSVPDWQCKHGPPVRVMMSRIRQFAKAVLALQCAAWIAVLPVVPQLHQALADHQHVYNPEHGRIEDAGPKPLAAVVFRRPSATPAIGAIERTPTGGNERTACRFSNAIGQKAKHHRIFTTLPFAFFQAKVTQPWESEAAPRPQSLLLTAPKHSPPEQAG